MSDTNFTITQDDTYAVPPDEIEQVVQQLWRESQGEEADATVMQVRTLNLLIVVPEDLARPPIFRAIDTVAVQHPGRTIAMVVTEGTEAPRAHVAIACRLGDGGKQVCGEQITITSGEGGAPLPSIAAALLLPGVPTFLWWLGTPAFGSPLFESFVESVDRVVVDSRSWDAPLRVLPQLGEAITRQPYIAFTDLQWTALTPWRRQTTQCFDLPQALPYLERLGAVTIEHGPEESDRIMALLFVGWLATRLGWQPAAPGADDDQLVLQSRSGTVAVQFVRTPHAGSLQRVSLTAFPAAFQLSFRPASGCVKTEILLPPNPPIERIARLATLSLEQVLSEDLDMLAHDTGFEEALQFAAQVASMRLIQTSG